MQTLSGSPANFAVYTGRVAHSAFVESGKSGGQFLWVAVSVSWCAIAGSMLISSQPAVEVLQVVPPGKAARWEQSVLERVQLE